MIPHGATAQKAPTSNVGTARFSDQYSMDSTYEWEVEEYIIGDTRVENKDDPNSFQLIRGTDIELQILKDPSSIDLSKSADLSDPQNLSQHFLLEYDNVEYDFNKSDQLFIWTFPPSGKTDTGGDINLITNFYIYNVYNILINGETLQFNSTVTGTVEDEINREDNEITLNYEREDGSSLVAKVQLSTGIMNEIDLRTTGSGDAPSISLEIERRGGGDGGFLPISPFWVLLPLLLIPLFMKKFKIR